MATTQRNFILGKMNKELDERLIKNGEYTDALNVKIMASGGSNDGTVRLSYGNTQLTSIEVGNLPLHDDAKCIGTFEDGSEDTIYWFITTPFIGGQACNRADLIVSFNTRLNVLNYHVVSTQSIEDATRTTLNFSPDKLITSINKVGDLLFFTDGINPPRKINVTRSYGQSNQAVNYLDVINEDELMVIKAPPSQAPVAKGLTLGTDDNFLEDKFVSFAYRYKYIDGEYSATSQFSQAVFGAKPFNLAVATGDNEGAVNLFDAVELTYNSGGDQVVGVDILYKEMNNNIIKIAERIDKSTAALTNNQDYTFSFDGKQTYTVLNSSEILRLYDNVPLTAEAQTIMSNRLVYGNYVEGNDMTTASGEKVSIDYDAYMAHSFQGFHEIQTDVVGIHNKTIGGHNEIVPCQVRIDVNPDLMVAGNVLDISIEFKSSDTISHGNTVIIPPTVVNFSYTLLQNFDSAHHLCTNADFKAKIGTLDSIKKVYDPANPTSTDLACAGATLTDIVNCAVTSPSLYATGHDVDNEPIGLASNWVLDHFFLQLPVMHFVNDLANPTSNGYGYLEALNVDAQILAPGNGKTLKSNRGYEAAMIYMDKYGRSSTPQVSGNSNASTTHADSTTINHINVNIPPSQVAPSWANRYKFVLKQTEDLYDTIYSTTYFRSGGSGDTYFLLEGENAAKVEKGDRLFVKKDIEGALSRSVPVTVLDKSVEEEGFRTFYDAANIAVIAPTGVYMKVNSSSFSSEITAEGAEEVPVVDGKSLGWTTDEESMFPTAKFGPFVGSIEGGTRVALDINFKRRGPSDGNNLCERRIYELDQVLTVSRDYDSFAEWWVGDDIKGTLNYGVEEVGGEGGPIFNEMANPGYIMTRADYDAGQMPHSLDTNYYQFVVELDGSVYLYARGTRSCGSSLKKRSTVSGSITISPVGGAIVFETEGQLSPDDVWYENEESFEIVDGLHMGNVANQTANIGAQLRLSFSNAVVFGDGIESMKINDSIIGNKMNLGHRVHGTQNIDFKKAHRFADLTYSGVVNDESNINKLNEFNGGLLNFKALEDSFGDIKIIDARRTDILVLQEDKVSTVMAGKNLLSMSDAVKGGALVAVPEVLGQQLARSEEYGISNNPESYCTSGGVRYFTDVKRGAVLQMKGDVLTNLADAGMTTFFKDSFTEDSRTSKIGGYDSFSQEYVLHNAVASVNDTEVVAIPCGSSVSLSLEAAEQVSFTVGYGENIGDAVTNITTTDGAFITMQCLVPDASPMSHSYSGAGLHTATCAKTNRTEENILYTFTSDIDTTINVEFACIVPVEYTVVQVVLTDASNSKETTVARYSTERSGYSSSIIDSPVNFGLYSDTNTIVSLDRHLTGFRGEGAIPLGGDTINVGVVKKQYETFPYQPASNRILAIQLASAFDITVPANLEALVGVATEVTNVAEILNPNGDIEFGGDFVLSSVAGTHLYIIYDLRTFNESLISYDATTVEEACCNQECESGTCGTYRLGNGRTASVTFTHTDCAGAAATTILIGGASLDVCSTTYPVPSVSSDKILITLMNCNCS
jgi:hypothetical protein